MVLKLGMFVQLRREKISERMKLLQDLVPGCSKVGISFFPLPFLSVHLVTNVMKLCFLKLNSGYRKGGDARRDHQLRPVPAEAGRGTLILLNNLVFIRYRCVRQRLMLLCPSPVQFLSMKIAASNPVVNFNIVEDLFGSRRLNHQACGGPAMTLPVHGQLDPSCLQMGAMQQQMQQQPPAAGFGLEMLVGNQYPQAQSGAATPVSLSAGASVESCHEVRVRLQTSFVVGSVWFMPF